MVSPEVTAVEGFIKVVYTTSKNTH